MKLVVAVRNDLNLTRGKMAVQVAHACVDAVLRSSKEKVRNWQEKGAKKVVTRVENEQAIFSLQQRAKAAGLVAVVIRDAGKTHIEPGTVTCLGIGPDSDEVMGVTADLKLIA